MDPDAALAALRDLANKQGTGSQRDWMNFIDEVCYRFNELDQWLSRGGFLPETWWPAKNKETRCLDAIHGLMDGQEWDSDTLDAIADMLRTSGRSIAEPNDIDGL